jgi:hypothetical protein
VKKMSKKATITITLTYDLDEHYDGFDYSGLPVDEIANDLEGMAYDDLTDLMRGDRLRSWADVEVK